MCLLGSVWILLGAIGFDYECEFDYEYAFWYSQILDKSSQNHCPTVLLFTTGIVVNIANSKARNCTRSQTRRSLLSVANRPTKLLAKLFCSNHAYA